jgi:hypothetical protein
MMPAAPGVGEYRTPQDIGVPTDARGIDSPTLFDFPGIAGFNLQALNFSPDSDGDAERAGETQPLRILSDGQSSFSLCLYALVGLGLCRSAPWVRKLSVGVIPDWYHGGGPWQVGHSMAISPDCCPVPIYCLVQPDHTREDSPSRHSRGTIMSLWRNSQFTPTVLAPRGPPYGS